MERQRKVRPFGHHFGQKFMRFGNQELQQYIRPKEHFNFEARQQLDQVQNCLVDNIWNIPTVPSIANYKITIINALINYF